LAADLLQKSIDAILFDVAERLGIDARRAVVPPDQFPRFPQDVTPVDAVVERVKPASRLPLGRDIEAASKFSYFVGGPTPAGVVGSGLAGHALALTLSAATTTPGVLPSDRVIIRGHRR
jgi:hypothetical protein